MATPSPSFSDLIGRHEALVRELVDVNAKLRRIAETSAATSSKSRGQNGNGHASNGNGQRSPSGRRSWYERGEAVSLMQKIARKPMSQADLVRAVTAKKQGTRTLSSSDQKRFASATYQAIANAVAGRKLIAAKDGTVRARA